MQGRTREWIANFLTDREQIVVVDGMSSSSKAVLSGVPQGSVLGPCLFLLFINDIAKNLHSTARLFADDTMVYLAVKNEDDARLLQEDLKTLEKWEDTWMMEFYPAKCEVITITRARSPIVYPYTLHGEPLKHVDTVKYLGVKINKDLKWDQHITMITKKATNSLNFLRRNININNREVKSNAYKALVRPLLEYSHTATLIKSMEAVQRRAARFVYRRYQRTSSVSAMITELQWQPLAER